MSLIHKMAATEVPADEQVYVDAFRRYIGDYANLNTLKETQESTDLELYMALILTLDELNDALVHRPNFESCTQVENVKTLLLGALLQLLTMKGILSARNTLTYNDAGGVSVQDYDTYGRYINIFNVLVNKYMNDIRVWNFRTNIDDCYSGVYSEYALGNSDGWYN